VSGITRGSHPSISPEQARGGKVDRRSDGCALGSILAEMITGKVVFQDDTLAGVLMKIHQADTGETIQEVARRVPLLAPVIHRSLALRPEDRFDDASALAAAIAKVRDEIPEGAPTAAWLQEFMTDATPRPSMSDVSVELPPPETHEFFGVPRPDDPRTPEEVAAAEADTAESEAEVTAEEKGEVTAEGVPTVLWAEQGNPGRTDELLRDVTEMELHGLLEEEEGPDVLVTSMPGLVLVRIHPGTYWMGSDRGEPGRYDDEDRHQVQLTRPIHVANTPVTQGQFEDLTKHNPSKSLGRKVPVQGVRWYDAIDFCNKLSKLEGLPPAYHIAKTGVTWDQESPGFRLPTEAEWEYAARAGSTTLYAGSNDPDEVAWYWGTSRGAPRAVARKAPNAWGLYDMSGNVWEWIWDRYGPYPTEGIEFDPAGPEVGNERCARGGSYYSKQRDLRLTCRRGRAKPGSRLDFLGFRVVATIVD